METVGVHSTHQLLLTQAPDMYTDMYASPRARRSTSIPVQHMEQQAERQSAVSRARQRNTNVYAQREDGFEMGMQLLTESQISHITEMLGNRSVAEIDEMSDAATILMTIHNSEDVQMTGTLSDVDSIFPGYPELEDHVYSAPAPISRTPPPPRFDRMARAEQYPEDHNTDSDIENNSEPEPKKRRATEPQKINQSGSETKRRRNTASAQQSSSSSSKSKGKGKESTKSQVNNTSSALHE